jgi:hypothetical protein
LGTCRLLRWKKHHCDRHHLLSHDHQRRPRSPRPLYGLSLAGRLNSQGPAPRVPLVRGARGLGNMTTFAGDHPAVAQSGSPPALRYRPRGTAYGKDLDPDVTGAMIREELPPIGYCRVSSSQLLPSPPPQNTTERTVCSAVTPIYWRINIISYARLVVKDIFV